MPVKISAVEKNSYAEKAGITAGESIVSINGNIIKDVLDYRFYMTDRDILVERASQNGETRTVEVKKP